MDNKHLENLVDKGWSNMELLLDEHMPNEKKKRRSIVWLWFILGNLAIFTIGYYKYKNPIANINKTIIAENYVNCATYEQEEKIDILLATDSDDARNPNNNTAVNYSITVKEFNRREDLLNNQNIVSGINNIKEKNNLPVVNKNLPLRGILHEEPVMPLKANEIDIMQDEVKQYTKDKLVPENISFLTNTVKYIENNKMDYTLTPHIPLKSRRFIIGGQIDGIFDNSLRLTGGSLGILAGQKFDNRVTISIIPSLTYLVNKKSYQINQSNGEFFDISTPISNGLIENVTIHNKLLLIGGEMQVGYSLSNRFAISMGSGLHYNIAKDIYVENKAQFVNTGSNFNLLDQIDLYSTTSTPKWAYSVTAQAKYMIYKGISANISYSYFGKLNTKTNVSNLDNSFYFNSRIRIGLGYTLSN